MTTKEIRVMLQDIYQLGDDIKERIGSMIDRETNEIRGALEYPYFIPDIYRRT